MIMKYEVIKTGDGSATIYVPDINETYHSKHGAINESRYVFIRNGFRYWLSENDTKHTSVLEIGLGTGLNVLLTIMEAVKFRIYVDYTSLEPYPLPGNIIKETNYAEMLGDDRLVAVNDKIHLSEWEKWIQIDPYFKLHKMKSRLEDMQLGDNQFDIIYFDAFAPNKQPEMWVIELLRKTTETLNPGGIWVTYSARGQLKRDLKSLGMIVETLPGPPGKKEMIRASAIK